MARQKMTGAKRSGTKRTPKSSADEPRSNAFFEAVKFGLDHIFDPQLLGERSPLSAPYFLGTVLTSTPEANTAAGRGQTLVRLLTTAVDTLDPVLRTVIDKYYLDPKVRRKRNRAIAVSTALGYSRPTVMRYLKEGIDAVASHLSQTVLPPLRTEWPGRRTVVGRRSLVSTLMAQLRQGQCVVLTGNSGMGKTSVGYLLAEEWGREQVLWFTLRSELNDRLLSLVLTLGYFLRNLGAGLTWSQLVADEGKLNDDALISSLIRQDLAALNPKPLICIDELEILRGELQEHMRLRHFIEELRGQVPLLLIGQRTVVDTLETHHQHDLSGLTADELKDLLSHEGVFYLSETEQAYLFQVTRGNPALIRMFAILYRAGETVANVFGRMGSEATAEAMLNRIWHKLETNERRFLIALAVFQGYAPRDAWTEPEALTALPQLFARGLIEDDNVGGIAVAPFTREFVLRQTSANARQEANEAAAKVREQRGEYSLAVGHYIAAYQPTTAVRLWAPHRHAERARGYGPLVLTQFRNVPLNQLETDDDRRILAVVVSELLYADGVSEAITQALGQVTWPDEHPLTPFALGLRGDAFELEGKLDEAAEAYEAALKALARPAGAKRVNLLRRLGHIHLYLDRDLDQALSEAFQARFEAELFAGNVAEEMGSYELAHQHYIAALSLADQVPNGIRQQRDCYSDLGRLAMRRGRLDDASNYLERAITLVQLAGRNLLLALDYMNLCGVLILQKQHEKALEVAVTGLKTCEQYGIKSNYHLAGLASNAGEACYYLGRYDNATTYAEQAIQAEEPAHLPYALTVMGMTRQAQGQLAQAVAYLDQSLQWAQKNGDRYAEASALRTQGDLHVAQTRKAEAVSSYEKGYAIFVQLGNNMEAKAIAAKLAVLK